jgi:hypothetical protein
VPGEMPADIGPFDLLFLAGFVSDADDFDTTAFANNPDCIGNSALPRGCRPSKSLHCQF